MSRADLVNLLGAGPRALWAIPVTLALLAVASTVTVVQRILVVRQQAMTKTTTSTGRVR